jgi:hypothetical protein
MKKVSLAVGGAAGAVAAQAFGMMAGPVAHATSVPQGTHRTTTSVRYFYSDGHGKDGLAADPACPHTSVNVAWSPSLNFYVEAIYGGNHCVAYELAYLDHKQTGLTERVRYWDGKTLLAEERLTGFFKGNATYWSVSPDISPATGVCGALVYNGTSTVVYGPVCVSTP